MVAAEVDVDAPEIARRALLEQRLVINATGPTTLRFLPPLVVTRGRDRRGARAARAGSSADNGHEDHPAARFAVQTAPVSALRGSS